MSTALLVTNLVPLPQSGGLGALWQEATVHSSLHLDYPCQAGEIGSLLSSCLGLSYPPPPHSFGSSKAPAGVLPHPST